MNEFPSNSNKYKEAKKADSANRPKVNKVVRGEVKTKKKNGLVKFADVFIKEDMNTVKNHAINDIVIPAIRDTIWSVFTNSLEMLIYPNGGGRSHRRGGYETYTPYSRYSSRDRRPNDYRDDYATPRTRFDLEDLIFPTHGDAVAVMDEMMDTVKRFGLVTVGNMYDMADRTAPYTSNDFGWTSLDPDRVRIQRVRDGYILKLPKAMPLD